MKTSFRTHAMATALLLTPITAALVAQPAFAQQRAVVASPVLTALSMDSDAGLRPGATLRLEVQATPGANPAQITLGDSGVRVDLREREPGTYVGSHVIRRSERIDPSQLLRVRLGYGSEVLAPNYYFPPSFRTQAAAPTPPVASDGPNIDRFVLRGRADGRYRPGEVLTFRLRGEPGADARFDIPGVARNVEMRELRPGVYEGSYTVRQRDDRGGINRAVARLESRGKTTTARVDLSGDRDEEPRAGRDERPPQVTEVTPAEGERVGDRGRAHISAKLTDEGSGVDPASVRLRVDGKDVTADTRMRGDELHFRDDLPAGRHTAEVVVRDKAGNATTKSWSFQVVDRDRNRDLDLRVTSHAEGAGIPVNGDIVLQGRTAPNATVRVQVESLLNVGGILNLTQPVADLTVQADNNGEFTARIPPRGLPIAGSRIEVRFTATRGNQVVEERLTLQTRG